MNWLISLWARAKGWLALAGAVIAAVGIAFLRGRSEGKRLMEAEQERGRLESLKRRKELDHEVENLGPADVDREFAKWMRDNHG